MTLIEEIREHLISLQDLSYRNFHAKLIPTMDSSVILGVRTPDLRKYAKELSKNSKINLEEFLSDLPHKYYEENNLHAFLIEMEKDEDQLLYEINRLLPYINNWATCDAISPKLFKKKKTKLLLEISRWIQSEETYTIRFAIEMLMKYFLDGEDFSLDYVDMVAAVRSDEYYVNMMIAWYFATALAKQYDAVLPYIEDHRLADWTHNKAIQKSIESYRITEEQKSYLRDLKLKKKKVYKIKYNI